MSQSTFETTELEALQIELETAHAYLEDALDGGDPFEISACQEEVSQLARQVADARISRPFTAYEDTYGDYPI